MSRLASQPVLQWLRSVTFEAWNSSVGALKPARPEILCFVSANLKIAGLYVMVKATVAFMCWAVSRRLIRSESANADSSLTVIWVC